MVLRALCVVVDGLATQIPMRIVTRQAGERSFALPKTGVLRQVDRLVADIPRLG